LQYTNRENRYYGNEKGSQESNEEGSKETSEEEITSQQATPKGDAHSVPLSVSVARSLSATMKIKDTPL
jgi:hypothetical protein